MAHPKLSLAALTFSLGAIPAEIQLTPPGPVFRAGDGSGRPVDAPGWQINAAIAGRLVAALSARTNPLVIDYEHQTLLADQNGQPAPAAGWFKTLEWREGAGLFAIDVQWTPRAETMLKAGEYRFISPVFTYDKKTGAVTGIRMAALTNNPGLDGMKAVALSARFEGVDFSTDVFTHEEPEMELKALLKALGLAEDKTEADALAALSALKTKAESADAAKTAAEAALSASRDELAALKAAPPTPAPELVVSLQNEIAALKAREVATLIAEADKAGKFVTQPGLKAFAENDVAPQGIAKLTAFLADLAPTAARQGMQSDGIERGKGGSGSGSVEAEAVMKAFGLSTDEFNKGKGV
ncbi:MAG: phage protease [Zoogloeaceae bacterium]|jgi:phage I-like protein|nr:phage protease [Zoogloeaceae bacterium]